MLLGVNIDHVATLRQARYKTMLDSPNAEPCPVQAAKIAEDAGADSITLHVRADRRHIQEHDAFAIQQECSIPINLEMGNTPELLEIALQLKPTFVCLVPETREEISTEGGLDVVKHAKEIEPTIRTLRENGILVSLFIDPDEAQVTTSKTLEAEMIELHTGSFANTDTVQRAEELQRLTIAAQQGFDLGLQVNAGHGINYQNIRELFVVPHLAELNIGHSIISRSITVGLSTAIAEMKTLTSEYDHHSK